MSTNPYRDSTSGDYLDKVKQHMLENRAGNTSSGTYTPRYIIPAADAVTTSDTVVVDPNKQSVSETITTTDTVTATGYTSFSFNNSGGTGGSGVGWNYAAFDNSSGGYP